MKILATGLNGLVGSRIAEVLSENHIFEDAAIDITNKQEIYKRIENSDAEIIIHLAAKTNVDGCELDKEEDQKILDEKKELQEKYFQEKKTAWGVNVYGTRNVAEACERVNKKLLYVSTDFVFDGTKESPYEEDDIPNPVNWYATTKYEGEKIVQATVSKSLIVRLAYPYRASFERNDFARAILSRLKNGKQIKAIEDHIFTPTFVDDFAIVVDKLLKLNQYGIFHTTGESYLTPFESAIKIAREFSLDESLVGKTTRDEYFFNKAKRPFFLGMKNVKIQKLGIKIRAFEEGIKEVKKQLNII